MKDITADEDFEIRVQFIPTKNMRYDTLGDYRWDQGQLLVQIAQEGDFMERMAILLHELAEWAFVHRDKIPFSKVDEWDFSHPDSPEPGEEVGCPYRQAHIAAIGVEQTFRVYANIPDIEKGHTENEEQDSASKYLRVD